MAFVTNAEDIARKAMISINPQLAWSYAKLIRFLSSHPGAASALRGRNAPRIGSAEYVRRQAVAFAKSREPRAPKEPKTFPDLMTSVILNEYFVVAKADLKRIQHEHLLSMSAENLVGHLLERYLASVLEPRRWVWCSSALIKAADFLKPPSTAGGTWFVLQVKNRDNSENSSSKAIRKGTTIEAWFRTFSKRSGSNWAAFPHTSLRAQFSEGAFKRFVLHYLRTLPVQDCVRVDGEVT